MGALQEYIQWNQDTGWIIFALGLISALVALSNPASLKKQTVGISVILALVLIWRFGFQPVGLGSGGDRDNYAYMFIDISENGLSSLENITDPFWSVISYVISWFGDYELYFIVLAIIYVGIYLTVSLKMAGGRSYWLIIAIALSFGFTGYAINTMRAGIAVAFLCLSLCYWRRPKMMLALMGASLFTHFSMLLPITMILLSRYYDRTRLYIKLWVLSVPLSFAAGGFFNNLFAKFVEDDRTAYLTNTENAGYNIGFRFDFIIYSLAPMLVGAYYIYKKRYEDRFYKILFNSYILSNIVWILVIRADFSDRFAYLSWFLIPFILVYPLVQKQKVVSNPGQWMAMILCADSLFNLML